MRNDWGYQLTLLAGKSLTHGLVALKQDSINSNTGHDHNIWRIVRNVGTRSCYKLSVQGTDLAYTYTK